MEDEYTFYDFHSRSLAVRRRTSRSSSSSSSCSLSTSECPDRCVVNCKCASAETCKKVGIIIGSVFGGVILIIIVVCLILWRTGKLKKMKTRTLNWAKSWKKPAKISNEPTPLQPVQNQGDFNQGAYPNNYFQEQNGFGTQFMQQPQPVTYGNPVFQPNQYDSVTYNPHPVYVQSGQPVYVQPGQPAFENYQSGPNYGQY